ncbi:MAG: hypothetical protein ACRDZ9_04845 [Acidimicrobiales bacterium]
MRPTVLSLAVAAAVVAVACGRGGPTTEAGGPPPEGPAAQPFPDVVDVEVTPTGERTYRFSVTLSSPYDSEERYADAWRVVGPDGAEYGVRPLAHPHAGEQPFTRSLDGIRVPEGVDRVTVEGRDKENGYGGETVTVDIPS